MTGHTKPSKHSAAADAGGAAPAFRAIPVESLGPCRFASPLAAEGAPFYPPEGIARHIEADELARYASLGEIEYFKQAGARERIFFDPAETTVGVVTCGGLCPGLNDVIRAVTFCALEQYGVRRVLGFPYGFEGLVGRYGHAPMELTLDGTDEIHEKGGTILKTSRGPQPVAEMVDTLVRHGVNILCAIGGDGTQRGAHALCEEIRRRRLPIAVVGIPKTIDNDIGVLQRSFGFETAVDRAWDIVTGAHAEAKACRNGVGLVKLMGRHSGWIATAATLSNSSVNFCLIPEVRFDLHGPNGFLHHLRQRLARKDHAVVVVAEGAGQDLLPAGGGADKSGNRQLQDIGLFLRDEIKAYFQREGLEVNVKYFDPGYVIRSMPANADDSGYCLQLGYSAVHAGMAGKTDLIVGLHADRLVHIPIALIGERKSVDPKSWYWQTVVQATRQPADMTHPRAGAS